MNTIYVKLLSRLGNQLFEVATAYHLAKTYKKRLVLLPNGNSGYEPYDIILKCSEGKEMPSNATTIKEPHTQPLMDLSIVKNCDDVIIEGYFQSDKYFTREDVEELFPIPTDIKEKYSYLEDYVCISVRRGDYLLLGNKFQVIPLRWYEKMYHKYFIGKKVLICGDDIEWCKNNFHIPNQEFLENDCTTSTDRLFIMAMCKNHIISASTFSWWAAYLSKGKVVAPYPWFGKGLAHLNQDDKYVDGWIKEKNDEML